MTVVECCRREQGARKKESNITSCDSFRKRCKCFQAVKACSEKFQCIGCENTNGKTRERMSSSPQIITIKEKMTTSDDNRECVWKKIYS